MQGVKKTKLKDGSVPTIFSYTKPIKRRLSSIQRQENSAKRVCLDDAFEQCPTKELQNVVMETGKRTADKCVDATIRVRTKERASQFRITDLIDSSGIPSTSTAPKEQIVLVKLPAPKKKEMASVETSTESVETNTELSFHPNDEISFVKVLGKDTTEKPVSEDLTDEDLTNELLDVPDEIDDRQKDPDYVPEPPEETEETVDDLPKDTKLVVFWTCLLPLLQYCTICQQLAVIKRKVFKGSQVIIDLICNNGHEYKWRSQPNVRGFASGNISLAASILFSGCTFQRIKELAGIAKIPFMSHVTFNSIQKRFLFPATHRVFITNRALLFDMVRTRGQLDLLGDGRCDSPGFSAKYGTYTVMDSITNYILDFHVSHCKMAGNSHAMELDGLKNVLRRFDDQKILISSLTTDRHKQVRAFLRMMRKDIDHQFDVCHTFGRNIKKKLLKLAKKKARRALQSWIKSIINHFW